jgi:ferritin-like metal-binding protein YciE
VGKRGDEAALSRSVRKIVQYLNEAHAGELGLRRDLQAQIAVTPAGRYRTQLARHLRETGRHADRIGERLAELGETRGRVQSGIGTATTLAGQLLNIGRAPLDLVRGSAGAERVLRNARDSAAAEALEIAAYTALERLAKDAGDRPTAKLAAWIRADEEAMLKKILAEIPALADAVAHASFDVEPPKALARRAGAPPADRGLSRAHDSARRATGSGGRATETSARGGTGGAGVNGRADKASVAARRMQNATDQPPASEPWAGYDGLSALEVIAGLDGASEARLKRTRRYETTRKKRATVIQATERELARS